MANITFIIGNGFDLNLKLNTRYTDFYPIYIEPHLDDKDEVKLFKKLIREEWEKWSDFELGIGEQSVEFKHGGDEFLNCISHFIAKFEEYLIKELERVDLNKINELTIALFVKSLLCFPDEFDTDEKLDKYNAVVEACKNEGVLNFLHFNYTNIFDELYKKSKNEFQSCLGQLGFRNKYSVEELGQNIHVHGEIGKQPVLGVYNSEQIKNVTIRANESVMSGLIKSSFFELRKRGLRESTIPANIGKRLIKKSDVICIYGCSIGETDKFWWLEIGSWLKKNNRLLVIIDFLPNINERSTFRDVTMWYAEKKKKERHFKDLFMRYAEWTEEDIELNSDKIIVELGDRLFKFGSILKSEVLI